MQAVEEDGGVAILEVAAGGSGEDFEDGVVDGGTIADGRHLEDSRAALVGDAGAGEAVVVAERLAAQGGRAAAVSVGEDVAAEVAALRVGGGLGAFGCEVLLVVHGSPRTFR